MTNRASAVALVSAMLSLPWLVLAPFSGVLADRIYRKHLLLTTRLTVAVLMLVESLLILSGLIEFWHMVVLAFLAGSAFAMDIPARQSLIPNTVHVSVVANAVAINTSVFSMTTIAGPMVGAGILSWLGPGGCFLALDVVDGFVRLHRLHDRGPAGKRRKTAPEQQRQHQVNSPGDHEDHSHNLDVDARDRRVHRPSEDRADDDERQTKPNVCIHGAPRPSRDSLSLSLADRR